MRSDGGGGTPGGQLDVLVITNGWPTPTRPMSGIFTQRQVDSLHARGVNVAVLAIDGHRHGSYRAAARRILRLNFEPQRYDLIHAHTGHCGVLACLQLRSPVVMSYVGYDLDAHLGEAETLRRKVQRVGFRWLSVLIAGTVAKSARGARRLPRPGASRNIVAPNGVDRDRFQPLGRHEARTALGWSQDEPVVLFAADPGRVEKRFELSEAAVARARAVFPALRLEVAADVAPAMMHVLYSAADALILTSVAEGSPNVVKEALACGLPVVSVDVGDVREVINGASNCYVCPPEVDPLAEALVAVISALPERTDGRERTGWLALDLIADRMIAAYGRALGRGPGPLGFLSRVSWRSAVVGPARSNST